MVENADGVEGGTERSRGRGSDNSGAAQQKTCDGVGDESGGGEDADAGSGVGVGYMYM